jgi:Txe/YoeB family toxin of Txe-Axe toxin-antitoxin module
VGCWSRRIAAEHRLIDKVTDVEMRPSEAPARP